MKRVQIEIDKVENKILEFKGIKIKIKPYLSTEDISTIFEICINKLSNVNIIENFALVRTIFDMLVVYKCSNVEVLGIEEKKVGNKISTTIDIDINSINKFEMSGIREFVISNISNYASVYSDVIELIKLQNVSNSILSLSNSIPTADDFTKNMKYINEVVSKLIKDKSLKHNNKSLVVDN